MTLWASACCASNTCFFDPTGEIEPRRATEAREVVRAGPRDGEKRKRETPRRREAEEGRVHRNSAMSKRQGPPKHQNRYAWKPNLNQKINETVSPLPPLVPRPFAELVGRPNLTVRNPRRCRSLGAGSGLCRRSPASASGAGTKSTGSAGGSHRFYRLVGVVSTVFVASRSDSFISFCRYGKYKPIVEPAKW